MWKALLLARQFGRVQTISSSQDRHGSSVTSEEARSDCITSINIVVHVLVSRIICVVVIEPTPIRSITYIHHPATLTLDYMSFNSQWTGIFCIYRKLGSLHFVEFKNMKIKLILAEQHTYFT
jgi:hypothetical protein